MRPRGMLRFWFIILERATADQPACSHFALKSIMTEIPVLFLLNSTVRINNRKLNNKINIIIPLNFFMVQANL